ncbi:MAG: FG-GAP-like repeat-containing protein, partial [Ignavibacteria bacterium]
MKRQSAKLLRLFIFILLIPSVPLLPQKVYEKELNIQDQSGNYSNPSATTSLIQTFPPLPPSGRNGSFLGEVVTSLGDVNGDGYDDFAIGLKHGAVYPSGLKLGKVYIYFGSNTLSSEQNPDLILTGETDSDRFGYSVASAGDVNNDGFPDIIVGAYFNSAVTLQQGRAYLYFGGPALDNVPDAVFTGEDLKDYFGFSVSSAGDVNNDGFSDLIVGAHFNSRGAEFSGSAYLYLGGTEPDNIPDLIFTGEGELDNFGNSVASAGDVNNDGFSDVIVGAFLNNRGGPDAGSAYLYFGGTAMDNIPDLIFSGTETSGHFGTSAASAGDLNNDGFSDIIIGNPLSNVFSGGRSWIYFGGAPMDNIPDVIAAGESGFDNFGAFVSAAGDVNNDGFSDVIVGATSGGFNITGRAYIYFGSTEMDSIPDLIFEGEANQDFFGTSVSAAGDINNDGFDDVIAGAYMNDGGGKDVGRAYIYYGAAGMDNTADIIFTGEKSYDNYGNSVSSAGDVNNDGFSDIIVGAYSNDDAAPDAGSAYLYFGGNGIEIKPDIIFYGEGLSDGFGISASSAGDLNNDSFSDVIIGSYFHNSGGLASGSAYIYFGGTAMDNTADLILAGEGSFENFGNSVASAGDMNNDGFSDLIVGA